MKKVMWVVGLLIRETPDGNVWALQGIFKSEKKALRACSVKSHFIAPMPLDKDTGLTPHEWEGFYYPFLE